MVKGRLLLVVLPILLAGCGGGGARPAVSADAILPVLGGKALDLAIADGTGATHPGMVGTGVTPGALDIAEGIGAMDVSATLAPTGAALRGQSLTLHLALSDTVAVGTAVALDGTASTAVYQDATGAAWRATSGTATVTALQTGTLTLALANVALVPATTGNAPLALSGTLTGRVDAPGRQARQPA